MIYLDTSAVVPLFVPEAGSAQAHAWRSRLSAEEMDTLAISPWTHTEYISAIGAKIRRKDLTLKQGVAAIDAFEQLFAAIAETISVEPRDFLRANEMLRHSGVNLRAGDALHLAIAANRDARQIIALDRELIQAARNFKLDARPPA